MLLRRFSKHIAAVRHFSAETVEAVAKPPTPAAAVNSETTAGGTTNSASNSGGRDTLSRRLLSRHSTKRSAVITIRKWKEEGHELRKFEVSYNVRLLRKHRRFKHALEICDWMLAQEDIKLLEGDYAVHLDLIAKVHGVNNAEKFYDDLPDRMKAQMTSTALLHTYVKQKMSSKAEALMEKMLERGLVKNNPLPYNHMISLYISYGKLEKALGLIAELKKNASPDILTYNLWLTICASQNDIDTAEKVFLEIKKAKVDLDWVTYSTLTNLYIKNSLNEKAAETLKEMEKRASRKVRVAYASIISLHASLGNKDEVQRVWKKIKSIFRKLNDAEYTSMISSLIKLKDFEEAEKVYREWESVSTTNDCRIPNLLLAAYINNNNQMEMAENFHSQMVSKGLTPSYTTLELLTWGYLKNKETEKALDCFKKAVGSVKNWTFDVKMVKELFGVLQDQKNVESAEQLLVVLRNAGHLNTEIYNLLLRTYANARKMPLVVSERMKKDKVQLDDETHELIKLTSKMCISEVSSSVS